MDKRGNNGIRKVMAGVKSEGEDASSTPSGVLARKRYKRAKGCVRRWILGWRTERRWVSYKTESGQTRYFEGEKRAAQRR